MPHFFLQICICYCQLFCMKKGFFKSLHLRSRAIWKLEYL